MAKNINLKRARAKKEKTRKDLAESIGLSPVKQCTDADRDRPVCDQFGPAGDLDKGEPFVSA